MREYRASLLDRPEANLERAAQGFSDEQWKEIAAALYNIGMVHPGNDDPIALNRVLRAIDESLTDGFDAETLVTAVEREQKLRKHNRRQAIGKDTGGRPSKVDQFVRTVEVAHVAAEKTPDLVPEEEVQTKAIDILDELSPSRPTWYKMRDRLHASETPYTTDDAEQWLESSTVSF